MNAIVTHQEKTVTVPGNPAELVNTTQLIDWIYLVVVDRIHLDEEDEICSDDEEDELSALAIKDTEQWCREMKEALQDFIDLREFIPRIVHTEYSHAPPAVSLLPNSLTPF